jgi:hypothetical protein
LCERQGIPLKKSRQSSGESELTRSRPDETTEDILEFPDIGLLGDDVAVVLLVELVDHDPREGTYLLVDASDHL